MNNTRKPPLGLTPREFWLRNRVSECIDALARAQDIEEWNAYRVQAKLLADELSYAVTEWEKYYPGVRHE